MRSPWLSLPAFLGVSAASLAAGPATAACNGVTGSLDTENGWITVWEREGALVGRTTVCLMEAREYPATLHIRVSAFGEATDHELSLPDGAEDQERLCESFQQASKIELRAQGLLAYRVWAC